MSDSQMEDEIRAGTIASMGQELGDLHYLLWHDLVWLHIKWQEYRELFAVSAKRIDLMNQTAPSFFQNLHDTLWQDVLLHLSRLVDPTSTSGQANLTFKRLPTLVDDPSRKATVNRLLDDVERDTHFARNWRHQRLAHRSLQHALDPEGNPLSPASRASVERALESSRLLMNYVESEYQGGRVAYEYSAGSLTGAATLLNYLDEGLEAEEARRVDFRPRRPRYL